MTQPALQISQSGLRDKNSSRAARHAIPYPREDALPRVPSNLLKDDFFISFLLLFAIPSGRKTGGLIAMVLVFHHFF
jgi:hypothetical protein